MGLNRAYSSLDIGRTFQRQTFHTLTMATGRKRLPTKEDIDDEIANDSHSDLSSEDELATAIDSISFGSEDEDFSSERQWRGGTFIPTVTQFMGADGLRNTISFAERTPLDYFQIFFDETLVQSIVDETNRYYSQNSVGERQHMSNWQNVNATEMYTFLAIAMLTGLVGKGRIRDYWSTDPLLSTPIFSQYFTRNRYQDILRFLHFANNEDVDSNNRLKKIKPIINDLKQKFSNCVNPAQNLCIDESLMLWKGRLGFKQYIPSKRNRFGIKSFCLVDCKTKFVLDFIVYTGSNTEYQMTTELGFSGSVVMELMRRYLNKGHHLYVDNWFASPALFEILHQNRTGACGTVRKNRQGLPSLITELKSDEIQYSHTDILLALK